MASFNGYNPVVNADISYESWCEVQLALILFIIIVVLTHSPSGHVAVSHLPLGSFPSARNKAQIW